MFLQGFKQGLYFITATQNKLGGKNCILEDHMINKTSVD